MTLKLYPLLLFILSLPLLAQHMPLPKTDDFERHRDWWLYHRDGNVADDEDALRNGNGYLKLRLNNPIDNLECNIGISERQPLYGKEIKRLVAETRVRVLNPMKDGSRGWGFWKTAKQGKADNLVWFMQQQLEDDAAASWSRFGAIYHQKADFIDWQPDEKWHVYKIVRDLRAKSSDFYVDGTLIHRTRAVAPSGDMAFHAWVDNQVYSRKKGIRRAAWFDSSIVVVDYVQIYDGFSPSVSMPATGMVKLLELNRRFLTGIEPFQKRVATGGGESLILATVRAEDMGRYDEADQLLFDDMPDLRWDGATLRGQTENKIQRLEEHKEIVLNASSNGAPYLSNLCVLSGGTVLLNQKDPVAGQKFDFENSNDAVVIYLSASVNEARDWNHVDAAAGRTPHGGKVELFLDGEKLPDVLDGNVLFGDNGLIVEQRRLAPGRHTLKINSRGNSHIARLLVYQQGEFNK